MQHKSIHVKIEFPSDFDCADRHDTFSCIPVTYKLLVFFFHLSLVVFLFFYFGNRRMLFRCVLGAVAENTLVGPRQKNTKTDRLAARGRDNISFIIYLSIIRVLVIYSRTGHEKHIRTGKRQSCGSRKLLKTVTINITVSNIFETSISTKIKIKTDRALKTLARKIAKPLIIASQRVFSIK